MNHELINLNANQFFWTKIAQKDLIFKDWTTTSSLAKMLLTTHLKTMTRQGTPLCRHSALPAPAVGWAKVDDQFFTLQKNGEMAEKKEMRS